MSGAEQLQDSEELIPETEANDLKELNLSATFLTPYAVAPKQDNEVWMTNTQQTYIDHTKQGMKLGSITLCSLLENPAL